MNTAQAMVGPSQLDAALAVGDRVLAEPGDVHPDWCVGYGQAGGHLVIGASAVGHLHLRGVVPRDDAFAARSTGPWLAVAVSDGVGSKRLSRYGSSFCVQALCEELLHSLVSETALLADSHAVDAHSPASSPRVAHDWREGRSPLTGRLLEDSTIAQLEEKAHHAGTLTWNRHLPPHASDHAAVNGEAFDADGQMSRAFAATRSRLERFVSDRSLDLHAVSCTLLGLLVNTERGSVVCGQVGDGLITLFHADTGPRAMVNAPAPGGVGATYVITQNDWQSYLTTAVLSDEEAAGISSLMLMTDGVSEDYSHPPPEGLLERWCQDMDARMRETSPSFASLRLLHWLASYEQPGSFDDRTLVAVLAPSRPTQNGSPTPAPELAQSQPPSPQQAQSPEAREHTADGKD
ncbi:protein phosphatase 2C domain-containing protein [Streptomyces avermitilis]|uniref:protein phosphatase 2C domain-containing protein n=1 Tax=Streptomyces avermitilis TaxID=33903 RepID=UPI0033A0CDC4